MEAGALPQLVALLQTGTGEDMEHSARALRGISFDGALCADVVDDGALPPLVALLQMGNGAAREHAARALANIACDDALRALANIARLPKKLIAVVQRTGFEHTHAFKLLPGDWLVFDNLRVQHGRLPYFQDPARPRCLLTVYSTPMPA